MGPERETRDRSATFVAAAIAIGLHVLAIGAFMVIGGDRNPPIASDAVLIDEKAAAFPLDTAAASLQPDSTSI